ncbi:hypothetical protein GCM10011515_08250 [Tsuneonella deserti]|uniref:Uncharacterized protein n=1 Tax=Tsuneonella deserti TaxID=2035528 RepID=A0ABQ1S2C7_9SPHN|nr:hypothetical protein [Tsuneonella deserti]GGD90937.1 hypothetical protein GCM10011515_08250 [Tsuneonella deserti]
MRTLTAMALVLLAGCGTQPGKAPSAPVSTAATAPVPSETAGREIRTTPRPANKAVLDAQGVIFDSPAGKTREFVFGSLRTEVDGLAERMFGHPDERSRNDECGAGPIEFSRYGPLTLNFQDGKLVGWLAHEGAQVVTSDGIRPGTKLRDLRVARSVRMIPDSTLEGEFDYLAADGHPIGGFVKGQGRDATVDSLYAGVNCFFR